MSGSARERASRPDPSDSAELVSPSVLRALPESGLAGVAVVAGTGLVTFAAQWVSVMLWVAPAEVSTVWVSGGLMLAVALLSEPRRWPAVISAAAAGSTLLFLTLRLVRPPGAVLLGLLAGLVTVAVAVVLRAILRRPFTLDTFAELLRYLLVAVLGGALAASILFIAGVSGMAIRPPTFLVWRTFLLSALLGYLTVTPTAVLLVRRACPLQRIAARRWLEAGLLGLLLTVASGFVFTGAVNRPAIWAAFAMTIPPLLLWTAVRFGALGASASLLLVTVISTLSTNQGLGPFTSQLPSDNTLSLQLFILGTGLPLLALAVVLGEQQRTSAVLRASHTRLRGLNRELISAREKEATRIARELHDDIGQRLALLSIGLSRLRQTYAEASPGPAADIKRLRDQATSIARSLREISHQLHPAALEHVGLVSALRLKCEEVHQATGLDVRLFDHGDLSAIPRDVALCLFRVAQEALNNVVRHSGARSVDLSLRRTGTELLLQLADDGRGFAPGALDQATGLGLHSATERVHSVGGTLTIDSAPRGGMTIRVSVPLLQADDEEAARHPRG